MKGKIKLFLLFSITALFLYGCHRQPRVLCRYVTQVEIFCDHNGLPITRTYNDNDKMEAVLLYLRLLRTGDAPQIDPDSIPADVYQITVSLSDGQQHVYSQKDHRYFRKGNAGWQNIPPAQAAGLYEVMRHYESDV